MSQPFLGEIRIVGFNFAPRGNSLVQGQILSIAQNTALFSLLGTTYGGNGTSTFQLPDLRGRVPVGMGQGPGLDSYILGEIAGSEEASILLSNLPAHTHVIAGTVSVTTTVATYSKVGDQASPSGHVLAKGEAATTPPAINQNYSDHASDGTLGGVSSSATPTLTNSLTGNNIPIDLLQPYLVMNYIIALTGIFPSRN